MPQHGAASRSSVDDRPCLNMGRAGIDTVWRTGLALTWDVHASIQRGGQNMPQHGTCMPRYSVADRPCPDMGLAGSYLIWRDGAFIYQTAESIQNRCAVYDSGRTAIVDINIIDSIFPFKFPIDI